MNSRTRLKLTLGATVFLVVTTFVSIARGMEGVATTCVAGVMTILSTYIWAETRRPSRGWRPGGDHTGDYYAGDYRAGDYHAGDNHTNAFPPDHHYTQRSTNEPGGQGRQNRRDVQDDYG